MHGWGTLAVGPELSAAAASRAKVHESVGEEEGVPTCQR